ncbi:unnamed protein product, partial [Lymnaea stagnalis]
QSQEHIRGVGKGWHILLNINRFNCSGYFHGKGRQIFAAPQVAPNPKLHHCTVMMRKSSRTMTSHTASDVNPVMTSAMTSGMTTSRTSMTVFWIALLISMWSKGLLTIRYETGIRAVASGSCPYGLLADADPLIVTGDLDFSSDEHPTAYDMHFTFGPKDAENLTDLPVVCTIRLIQLCGVNHTAGCYCLF